MVVTDGVLVSMTLSDGVHASANIIPADGNLGEQLISLEKFNLFKIHEASSYKIIQNVVQLQGHSCKIGNIGHPGTSKFQNCQFNEIGQFSFVHLKISGIV